MAELAQGCNIIGIPPGDPHKNFDMKRWRLLNNLVEGGLRCYYDHVIVGDVDELVVVDPPAQGGQNLLEFLSGKPLRRALTPPLGGLEVVHRIDKEPEAVTDRILGPRRHVRLAPPHYSKPCVISAGGTKIARGGGHFTKLDKLHTPPDALYLFHLKFCDFPPEYVSAMNRRNAVTQEIGGAGGVKDTAIGRHWFAEARGGEDRATFEAFADLPMHEGFDMKPYRQAMHDSWKARGTTGFWEFDRPDISAQFELPERFFGVF